jgi:hypothetical protein
MNGAAEEINKHIAVLKNVLLRRKIDKWAMLTRHSKKPLAVSKYEDIVVPFMYLNAIYSNIMPLEESHIPTIIAFAKSPHQKEVEMAKMILSRYCDMCYKQEMPEQISQLFREHPDIEEFYGKNWWNY